MRLKQSKRAYLLTAVAVFCLLGLVGYGVLARWPGLGAQVAKPLRGLIGNERVAQLETLFFGLQDQAKQAQYQLGMEEAAAPWAVETATAVPTVPTATATATPSLPTATSQPDSPTSEATRPSSTPTAVASPTPTPSPTATAWGLANLPPFATLAGEGVWQPYLHDETGQPLAVRTFLQPDPERPYALVALVAFDLTRVDLHFVLGSDEPALAGGPRGDGYLANEHKLADVLLATFNGGFMASHGEYGAMADGLVALPAKDGYATVVIHDDGRVAIGEWGLDIDPQGNYQAWRQNARLITQNGQITERVYNGSAATWGSSLTGEVITWRSALGIDESGQILYFAAGPSLSMPVLATALQATGAYNSLLLDINETWVHFTAVVADGDSLQAEPLLPAMSSSVDRYLRQSRRDFFYVTVSP